MSYGTEQCPQTTERRAEQEPAAQLGAQVHGVAHQHAARALLDSPTRARTTATHDIIIIYNAMLAAHAHAHAHARQYS